jgi:hypothetical protein
MGPRGRVRARQPGPDLRHAGGDRRGLAAIAGGRRRRRARPRIRLRAHRGAGHAAGGARAAGRAARAGRRRARRALPRRRRGAYRGRLRLVRDLQLGRQRIIPLRAQHAVLDRRRLVGRRARRAQPRRRNPLVERAAPGRLRCEDRRWTQPRPGQGDLGPDRTAARAGHAADQAGGRMPGRSPEPGRTSQRPGRSGRRTGRPRRLCRRPDRADQPRPPARRHGDAHAH